jgi:2-polyprenyl-3-methyl-5-hydroxy-6-metoxy-1,4-benzoquinol methylase
MKFSDDYYLKDSLYYNLKRPEILKFIPGNAKLVLEVGCGSGLFGKNLIETQNCIVYGIEPHFESYLLAKQNLTVALNSVFDEEIEVKLQDMKFDVILFNDVLEHILNPEFALQLAKKFLNKNGVVVASIPNIRYYPHLLEVLFEKDWLYRESGTLDKTHVKFFTSKSMRRLFNSEGYDVIDHQGINEYKDRKLNILFRLFPKFFGDMKYLQFVTVAKPLNLDL